MILDDCRLRRIQYILPQQLAIATSIVRDRLDRLGIVLHHICWSDDRRNGDGSPGSAEGNDDWDFNHDDRISCVELGECCRYSSTPQLLMSFDILQCTELWHFFLCQSLFISSGIALM